MFFAKWEEGKHLMGPLGACGPPGCDRWLANMFEMLVAVTAELEVSDLRICPWSWPSQRMACVPSTHERDSQGQGFNRKADQGYSSQGSQDGQGRRRTTAQSRRKRG